MKLFKKQTEMRLGAAILLIWSLAHIHFGFTFGFGSFDIKTNPVGFWLSTSLLFLLSVFLFVFSAVRKKYLNKFSKLVNDTELKDIASKKYNKSLKRDSRPKRPPAA